MILDDLMIMTTIYDSFMTVHRIKKAVFGDEIEIGEIKKRST